MSEYRMGDYNRGGYLAFLFCMAFTMVFFVYIAFIHPGVDLKEMSVAAPAKDAQVVPAQPAAEAPAKPAN